MEKKKKLCFSCFSAGAIVPAGLMVGVSFLDCSHSALAVGLLTMGVAMTGCLYGAGLFINFSDLSPRHAGVLYGISNTIATIPGFVAPIVIGMITHDVSYVWRGTSVACLVYLPNSIKEDNAFSFYSQFAEKQNTQRHTAWFTYQIPLKKTMLSHFIHSLLKNKTHRDILLGLPTKFH